MVQIDNYFTLHIKFIKHLRITPNVHNPYECDSCLLNIRQWHRYDELNEMAKMEYKYSTILLAELSRA